MSEQPYCGEELDLFAEVRNWKRYWSQSILRYISGDVLEVGAGTGSNTEFLIARGAQHWFCLEPDRRLLDQLRQKVDEQRLSAKTLRGFDMICGTLSSVDTSLRFDTIIYIDVLEHIEDDRGELGLAAARLRPAGHLIVLSPAHQWLFTPFDAAIGHFRRYNRRMFRAISPPELRIEKLLYLDSAGMLASAANRMLLRQSMPTASQLRFWDRGIIPISRVLDVLLGHSIGKTIVGVWRRS